MILPQETQPVNGFRTLLNLVEKEQRPLGECRDIEPGSNASQQLLCRTGSPEQRQIFESLQIELEEQIEA